MAGRSQAIYTRAVNEPDVEWCTELLFEGVAWRCMHGTVGHGLIQHMRYHLHRH